MPPFRYTKISEVKIMNRAWSLRYGMRYWFDKGELDFYGTTVFRKVYKGKYFITLEDPKVRGESQLSLGYTVREASVEGRIETVSEYRQFATYGEAEKFIGTLPG